MSSLNAFGEADYPLPIGVMTFWCGDVNGVVQPPQGWLICDGAEISKAEYQIVLAERKPKAMENYPSIRQLIQE